MDRKLKVVWICHFSNEKIRSHLKFGLYPLDVLRKFTGRTPVKGSDFAVWNTNAIQEFEKYEEIDLSIIMPHYGIRGGKQEFSIEGIHYYCFRSEDDKVLWHILHRNDKDPQYLENRKYIKETIKKIKPDLIHIIGAENPYYGLSALDISPNVPIIVSLQTLLSDPEFIQNYSMDSTLYDYKKRVEQEIIKRSDYIATPVREFRTIISQTVKPCALYLDISLAVGINVELETCQKEYDFVYFAANINKAADEAIEAFALACKVNSKLTLDISGGYDSDYKKMLDNRIALLGISNNVTFSGPKKSHSDVLKHIKKAKYALLPLKIDLISGTIREAMACGLPVITTITPATPSLNENRESVLLAPKGDYQAIAQKMLYLLDNPSVGEILIKNAMTTINEKYSNESFMKGWKDSYFNVVEKDIH